MLVELLLGDFDGKIVRVEDLVAVRCQERRFDAAWNGLPAVKEEDFHAVNCLHTCFERQSVLTCERKSEMELYLELIRAYRLHGLRLCLRRSANHGG